MKSKSFELPKNSPDEVKHNKTFDFVKYYKPAPESDIENNVSKVKNQTPKRQHSPNKNKKKNKKEMEVAQVNIDGSNLSSAGGNSLETNHVTSTPNTTSKKDKTCKVKSIMKNSMVEESLDVSDVQVANAKPKKRNKSVSFMLEENEEVVVKKSKSEESMAVKKSHNDKINKKSKKNKSSDHKKPDDKENESDVSNMDMDQAERPSKKQLKSKSKTEKMQLENTSNAEIVEDASGDSQILNKSEKKLRKKKKVVPSEVNDETNSGIVEDTMNVDTESKNEDKIVKLKKKKHLPKSSQMTSETDGEPVTKSRKKDLKPEIIAEGLENLNIGDNPHSLTSLIDEMTVADKKKKKNNPMFKKDKSTKVFSRKRFDAPKQEASTEQVEEKEKVKWVKRKFNKDRKGTISDNSSRSISVENLPIKIICSYRKLLTEHFTKFGTVRHVGAAEFYPAEDPKPVFTTLIVFSNDNEAEKSLEEDNTLFNGSRIRVKKALPPTQTTLVVRSYAELSMQALSTLFSGAGRIRNIHYILKGKNTCSTAFIDFDGPETLNRALKMAENAKIGAKKIHVSKYEVRKTNQDTESITNSAR